MAWVMRGTVVGRLLNVSVGQKFILGRNGNKLLMPQLTAVHAANITGKALRDKTKKRPPPYPYKEKGYTFFNSIFEKTYWRFDENSKIIVVEGPIAAGKTTFAKDLAEDLDMLYMPECNMDMLYVNEYGYDLRNLDPQLPESCRSFDIKDFYKNPKHRSVAGFQINMYQLRYSQYVDALAHLMNTGQGVVLERCAYSDFVFLETMHKCGYVSKGARSMYYDIINNTMDQLLRPHLLIYLDINVNTVMERIKKRNMTHEVNSKVLTSEYLSSMEDYYKKYLKDMSEHAELLVYDWSDFGDVEVVIEDIERIDFKAYGPYDKKFKDWTLDEEELSDLRMLYTSQKMLLMNDFDIPRFDVPELLISPDDWEKKMNLYNNAPGNKYDYGFNKDQGDKNFLFK